MGEASILEKVPGLEQKLDYSTVELILAMEAHDLGMGTKENIFTTVIRDLKLQRDSEKNSYMLAIAKWYTGEQ